jgi:hydrogenase maturation factor
VSLSHAGDWGFVWLGFRIEEIRKEKKKEKIGAGK